MLKTKFHYFDKMFLGEIEWKRTWENDEAIVGIIVCNIVPINDSTESWYIAFIVYLGHWGN